MSYGKNKVRTEETAMNQLQDKFNEIMNADVPKEYAARYNKAKIDSNIVRMQVLAGYMFVVELLMQVFTVINPQSGAGNSEYLPLFITLSLLTLVLGVTFYIISILCKRGRVKNMRLQWMLPFMLMYMYIAIQLAFFVLNMSLGSYAVTSLITVVVLLSFSMIETPKTIIVNAFFCNTIALVAMINAQALHPDVWAMESILDMWMHEFLVSILLVAMAIVSVRLYRRSHLNQFLLEESLERESKLARTDSLTGILNRRGFFEWADENWQSWCKDGRRVLVVMSDIDNFKQYNDQYGHLAGDDCLLRVSTALQRISDELGGKLCRFGGEEFLMMLFPETETEVISFVKRTHESVPDCKISSIGGINGVVTISTGYISEAVEGDVDYERLINSADMALYQAKRGGRNKIIEYRGEERIVAHVRSAARGENYNGEEKRRNNK